MMQYPINLNEHSIVRRFRTVSTWFSWNKVINNRSIMDMEVALMRFAETEPYWRDRYFDPYFIESQVMPLLVLFHQAGSILTADDIAFLWDETYGRGSLSERKETVRRLSAELSRALSGSGRN